MTRDTQLSQNKPSLARAWAPAVTHTAVLHAYFIHLRHFKSKLHCTHLIVSRLRALMSSMYQNSVELSVVGLCRWEILPHRGDRLLKPFEDKVESRGVLHCAPWAVYYESIQSVLIVCLWLQRCQQLQHRVVTLEHSTSDGTARMYSTTSTGMTSTHRLRSPLSTWPRIWIASSLISSSEW